MRKFFTLMALAAGLAAGQAALVETYSFSGLNQTVPDGNAAGMINAQTISSSIASISSITVGLHISGGYNGDLYISLQHSSGFSVLLNRAGRTGSDAYGYADSGFNVRFDDTAANGNVHGYQNVVLPGAGSPLTGTWQPDGRNVDPDFVTGASPQSAFLSSFQGLAASGTWTLFASDMVSGGGTAVLESWDLEITAVPEPTTVALGIFASMVIGGSVLARLRVRSGKKSRPNCGT